MSSKEWTRSANEKQLAAINEELQEKLKTPISELELSVRSANCLREAKILTIGELVDKSPAELLQYRNFGKKSLAEIEELLKGMGLSLGASSGAETAGKSETS